MVGHGTVRTLVLGPEDRAPTAAEMEEMKEQIARAMDLAGSMARVDIAL